MGVVIENPARLGVFLVVLQLAAVQGQKGPRPGGADEKARRCDGDGVETELVRPDLLTGLGYGGSRSLLDGVQLEAASQTVMLDEGRAHAPDCRIVEGGLEEGDGSLLLRERNQLFLLG